VRHGGVRGLIRTCPLVLSEETPFPYLREGGKEGVEYMEGGVRMLNPFPGELSAAPIQSDPLLHPVLPQRVLVGGLCSHVRMDAGGLGRLGEQVDRREQDHRPLLDPRRLQGSLDERFECL
jgi:hypothetical protein